MTRASSAARRLKRTLKQSPNIRIVAAHTHPMWLDLNFKES